MFRALENLLDWVKLIYSARKKKKYLARVNDKRAWTLGAWLFAGNRFHRTDRPGRGNADKRIITAMKITGATGCLYRAGTPPVQTRPWGRFVKSNELSFLCRARCAPPETFDVARSKIGRSHQTCTVNTRVSSTRKFCDSSSTINPRVLPICHYYRCVYFTLICLKNRLRNEPTLTRLILHYLWKHTCLHQKFHRK